MSGPASPKPAPKATPKAIRCPICGREAHVDWHPFCSRRCADVDLGRWLTGAYAIPGDDDDDTPSALPDDAPRH